MSFSVSAVGKVEKVRHSLKRSFEVARKGLDHVPPEQVAVNAIETAVNAVLETMDPRLAVSVSTHGSVSFIDGTVRSATLELKVSTLFLDE